MSLKSPKFTALSLVLAVACIIIVLFFTSIGGGWSVSPDFSGKSARFEISGAACAKDRCLAVNDEKEWAQEFTIDGHQLVPGDRLYLLPKGAGEIDAEAVATANGVFYIAGSHGLSRYSATLRASQFLLFRWTPDTGKIEQTDRLRDVIRQEDNLKGFAEQPLDENGVNIEGMAVQDDRLFFGFRGPNIDGKAFVLEASTQALFGDGPIPTTTHEIALGQRIGIRDMVRVRDGFLLLAGPVNDAPKIASIVAWTPGRSPQTLATLKPMGKGKAEALLVLDDTASELRVLIFYDSLKNGAPRELKIQCPSR